MENTMIDPAPPDRPEDVRSGDPAKTHPTKRPPSLDPRSQAAVDNPGVDDQADLLDPALDDQPGERNAGGTSFLDDVRSDGDQDERNERR